MAAQDLPPLADPSDLALRLRAPADDPLVALAVRRASDRFRAAVGFPVTEQLGDTLEVDGGGSDTLLLPSAPVRNITAVVIAWPAHTGLPPETVVHYQANKRLGILRRDHGWWPDGLGNIAVTCDHGFTAIPGDIADAVLEQAEQQYVALAGIDQATLGGQSISFGRQGSSGVTQRWAEAVARYQIGRGDRS